MEPEDPFARARARAKALYKLQRWRDCIVAMRALLGERPGDGDLHAHIAHAQYALGDHAAALADIDAALASDPDHEWYYRLRSVILEGLHRYHEALDAAREALRCAPGSVIAHGRVAESARYLGLHDESLEASANALQLDSSHAELWVVRARALAAVGDAPGAIDAYHRVLAIEPEHRYAHNALAGLLEGDEAIAAARRGLAIDAASTFNLYALVEPLVLVERFDEAIEVVRGIVATTPDDHSYFSLCRVLVRAGRLDEAWDESARAIAIAPSSPLAWCMRLDIAGRRGDLATARAALAHALDAHAHPPIFPLLASVHRHLTLADAAVVCERSVARDPTVAWQLALAGIRARQGRLDEAIAACEAALPRLHAWEVLMDIAAFARRPDLAEQLPAKLPHAGSQIHATIQGHAARAFGDWAIAARAYRAALATRYYCCAAFGLAHAQRMLGEDPAPTLAVRRTRLGDCTSLARYLAELG